MTQQKLNYIHYYLLAIVSTVLVWGGFEYVSICNGQNCMIDTYRLWNGLALIALIFIPITLCIWSEYVNGKIKNLGRFLKRTYEEQVLIFGICILTLLFFVSYKAFNIYWGEFVGTRASKEYVAALVNVAIFVATMFAPIAALLLYNNWKVQHNKKIISDEAKNLLISVENDNVNYTGLIAAFKSVDSTQPVQNIYNDLISKYVSNFNKNSEYNHNLSYLVHELNECDLFKKTMDNYNTVTSSIMKDLQKRLIKNQKTEDILKNLESIRRNYLLLNKLYKEEIKKHILAK